MTMIKAYAYLRVSGKSQIQGNGFDRQLAMIKKFTQSSDFELAGIYQEEGISGTKNAEDRPAFKEMVSAILSNGVRTIVVESLDRLAREYRIQESLLIYLSAQDIDLYVANTGENITEALSGDPMKKALIQMQGIFSELDKSMLVNKLRKAREKVKAETGKCEGRKAFGDTPEEALIVRQIRLMRRNRKGNGKALSYQAIADRLNQDGILTKDGCRWSKGQVYTVANR